MMPSSKILGPYLFTATVTSICMVHGFTGIASSGLLIAATKSPVSSSELGASRRDVLTKAVPAFLVATTSSAKPADATRVCIDIPDIPKLPAFPEISLPARPEKLLPMSRGNGEAGNNKRRKDKEIIQPPPPEPITYAGYYLDTNYPDGYGILRPDYVKGGAILIVIEDATASDQQQPKKVPIQTKYNAKTNTTELKLAGYDIPAIVSLANETVSFPDGTVWTKVPKSSLFGIYHDVSRHPKGYRIVRATPSTTKVSIEWQDQPDSTPYTVLGIWNKKLSVLTLDLSPKSGPKREKLQLDPTTGNLVFPDGTIWSKF